MQLTTDHVHLVMRPMTDHTLLRNQRETSLKICETQRRRVYLIMVMLVGPPCVPNVENKVVTYGGKRFHYSQSLQLEKIVWQLIGPYVFQHFHLMHT
jgi:hypothetical protein